jgi:aspartate-semialdehyde dehydrogenase
MKTMAPRQRIPVGVLGATGMAGQRYLQLLHQHPWFDVCFLAASPRSAGKSYQEAVAGRWHLAGEIPEEVRDLVVREVGEVDLARKTCRLVFSAVDSVVAREWEFVYARAGLAVVSNASAHRGEEDVPMLLPEVNPEHLEVLALQKKRRGLGQGFLVVKPNCSLQSYLTPLAALRERFGLRKVLVTTMQALSGAGHPGVSSLDALDNVVPLIVGEEEKSEVEPLKILGKVTPKGIRPAQAPVISAHCNRVAVRDGHLACVSVEFERKPRLASVRKLWREFSALPQKLDLPSAPHPALIVRSELDRPQPLRDRDAGGGMAVSVGRLRACKVLDLRFVGLSHNTLRGAAGGGILIAELLVTKELL